SFQIRREFLRRSVAQLPISCHGSMDDRCKLARHTGLTAFQGYGCCGKNSLKNLGAVDPLKRTRASERMVEEGAQRLDVRSLIDKLASSLLGRHVSRRAQNRTNGSGALGWDPIGSRSDAWILACLRQIFGETPIDDDGFAERTDHDVIWFQVAVDDSF